MFDTLKKALSIVDVVSLVSEVDYNLVGEDTYVPDGDECPSCNHKGCFRIKYNGTNEEGFAKCFSENKTWDVVSIVAELKDLTNKEAALMLAEHYKVSLPSNYSPLQELMDLAAKYYHTKLLESGPHAELNGLTAKEYQMQIRKHSEESISEFMIGWSDGGLVTYLESLGIDANIIADSGLAGKRGSDFLPSKAFIYPHMVRGRVSHFTFKDPLKQKAFQLPNKYKLNGHSFYNSDSSFKEGPVAIVEGENDAISLSESSWDSGVVCCIGSISSSQLEWLTVNLRGRDIVTFFDNDPAGDTYRLKVSKLANNFKSLLQVKVSGQCKDIDEYLKSGGDLSALVGNSTPEVTVSTEEDDIPISVENGCYYKVTYKDGKEYAKKITDFTIDLLNIYRTPSAINDGLDEVDREITITMSNGKKSLPVLVSSEAKIKLPLFRVLLANAMEADFYGTEVDLGEMWKKILRDSKERIVYLLYKVGRVDNVRIHGWLFRDCFISDEGPVYYPDEKGVMWAISPTEGIKPVSIVSGDTENPTGIPKIVSDLSPEERFKLTGKVLHALAVNLGSMGDALTMLSFGWATIHSNTIFAEFNRFPHLQFWGVTGKGKSYFLKLMLDLFNMHQAGYSSIGNLNSGVATSRKMSYYCSLPLGVDEIRADSTALEWSPTFRGWYDRIPRTIGTKEGNGIKSFPINSTTVFNGEDLFTDDATRSRCIQVRIRSVGRELVKSYQILVDNTSDMHAIGYDWILGYKDVNKKKLVEEINTYIKFLSSNGVNARSSFNWACVGVFAARLTKAYCPEFNYMEFLSKVTKTEQTEAKEDSTLSSFWKEVEGVQSQDRALISSDHVSIEGNNMHVWFVEIFRILKSQSKSNFSKSAILAAIKEEPYFISEGRNRMGASGMYRRGITLDIEKGGETLSTIAAFLAR